MRNSKGVETVTSEKQPLQFTTVDATGKVWAIPASPNERTKKGRKTWTMWWFAQAQIAKLTALGHAPVLGIQMAGAPPELHAIDVDTKDAEARDRQWATVATHSYSEYSPSGFGLRIFFKHNEPWQGTRHSEQPMEFYHGGESRFIRFTGNSLHLIIEDAALFDRLNPHITPRGERRENVTYDIGELPDLTDIMPALADLNDQDKEEIIRAGTGDWHKNGDEDDVSKTGWKLSIIFAAHGLTIEGALAAMLHLKAFAEHYDIENLERKLANYWWVKAVALVNERAAERTKMGEHMEQMVSDEIERRNSEAEAYYQDALLTIDASATPKEAQLEPTLVPHHPKVDELKAALAAEISDANLFPHLLGTAVFEILDKLTALICDVEDVPPVTGSTTLGEPGAGKSQAAGPMTALFSPERLQSLTMASAQLNPAVFRIHTDFKSPEDIRDKSRSNKFDLIMLHDADGFFTGLDTNSSSKSKLSGASTYYISDYDGRSVRPATGANAAETDYIILVRPVKQYALNTQPALIAPTITPSVVSKGTLSRFLFMYLPLVSNDDGLRAFFRSKRIVFPQWVDDILLFYMARSQKEHPRAPFNFQIDDNVRRMMETKRRELEKRFPPELKNGLAHFDEAVSRVARMHDALHLVFPDPHTDCVATLPLSTAAITFGLAVIEQSYNVLHYLDGTHGLGLMSETLRYRYAWKGILAHLREQQKKGLPQFKPSRADQLARTKGGGSVKYIINGLADEYPELFLRTNRKIRVEDYPKAITVAHAQLLECGGVDEPYKKQ